MDTKTQTDSLGAALFGKTRRAVLSHLYGHPDEAFYLRQLVRETGAGLGPVQREVRRLHDAGIISRRRSGNQVYFQADPACPIYGELQSLVAKSIGVPDVLRAALRPLSDRIALAFLFGSAASGQVRAISDIDLFIVGSVAFGEVVSHLGQAQEKLAREINPVVYPVEEFRLKWEAKHHFIRSVVQGEKIHLIGDDRELAGLVE